MMLAEVPVGNNGDADASSTNTSSVGSNTTSITSTSAPRRAAETPIQHQQSALLTGSFLILFNAKYHR